MGLWQRLRQRWHRTPRPSREASEAVGTARQSNTQAGADLRRAQQRQAEAVRETAKLRRHNIANDYDDWIRRIVRGEP